ncbi:DNA-binding MltR family transcriptional regulator [Peteryoungia aggregata LMG 23059]|uniref:DNA-binding MltR family transcriptional regulator n=1 Tax=Peteryoungia aggregata LMG 23059 TaxID=1368425 RepID=A0ABU0GDX1_9HYPH|nr:DNA-binding MltR family transcriptional regulator [Peteryoungia aggregata LMG 23059]
MAKRSTIPTESLSSETEALYQVLNEESDLAAILIGVAFIDACLASLLEKKFVAGETSSALLNEGPLGSMMSRAQLCYAMGLIPKKWYQDLRTLAEMRNRVAHNHLALSFEDHDIASHCGRLSSYVSVMGSDAEGRNRFILCVVMLSNFLILDALSLQQLGRPTRRELPKSTALKLEAPRSRSSRLASRLSDDS